MNINNAIVKAQQLFSFSVKDKSGPLWKMMPGNYTTTLFKTIYFPAGFLVDIPLDALMVLCHELTHLYDEDKGPVKFSLSYMFPQILAPLSLLLLLWHWWLALIVGLVLLFPFPAPFRTNIEKRAYTTTLYILSKLIKDGKTDASNWPKQVVYVSSQFHVWVYYFMSWGKDVDNYFSNLTMDDVGSILEDDLRDKLDQVYSAFGS